MVYTQPYLSQCVFVNKRFIAFDKNEYELRVFTEQIKMLCIHTIRTNALQKIMAVCD